MREQFNFDQRGIDQRTDGLQQPMLDSTRTLALSRNIDTHKLKMLIENVSSNRKTIPLMQKSMWNSNCDKVFAGNSSILTVNYNKWSKAQQNGTSILEKSEKDKVKKEKKLLELQAEVDTKMMAECTFKPQTNKSVIKRSLNQFLESQENHSKKIKEKRETLHKTLTKSLMETQKFKPTINRNANNRKGTTPVYDRLYNLRERQSERIESESVKVDSFKPSIHKKSQNMVRTIPVGQLLYQDALRRTNTQKEAFNSANQKESRLREGNRNSKNDKYAAQKFIKEYYYCLEDLQLDECKQEFSLEMFIQILKGTGFMGSQQPWKQEDDNPTTSEQKQLVQQAYTILSEFGIDARNVCVFLLGLLGIYNINPVNFQRIRQPQSQEEQFNLDQEEGRKLQKYFIRLFHNKMSSQALKKTSYVDENTYQPTTNIQSTEMAQRYRGKMVELAHEVMNRNDVELILPEDGPISHTNLLLIHKLAQEVQLENRRNQKKNITDPECTFKPRTEKSEAETPRHHHQNSKTGINKSNQLYSQAKFKQNSAKTNTSQTRNNQKDKSVNNLHKNQMKVSTQKDAFNNTKNNKEISLSNTDRDLNNTSKRPKSSPYFAKDIDKTLVRMNEGRKKREEQNKLLERGENNLKRKANHTQKQNRVEISDNLDCKKKLVQQNFQQNSPPKQTVEDQVLQRQVQVLVNNGLSERQNFIGKEPLLVIDVNMGDETEQIEIYRGDQERLIEIVEQFCKRHELDQESQQQLMEMVDIEVQEAMRTT